MVNKKAVAEFKVTVKNPDTINTSYTPTGKKKIILDETSATPVSYTHLVYIVCVFVDRE